MQRPSKPQVVRFKSYSGCMEKLYWVSLPYATFGIISKDGWVIDAAPIAKWAIGKTMNEVWKYYTYKKKAVIRECSSAW